MTFSSQLIPLVRFEDLGNGSEAKVLPGANWQSSARAGFRSLENENELVAGLARMGFAEFIPEIHTVAEQISIVSQARIIGCPGGSGLFLSLFAKKADLIVDIEPSASWLHAHANVLASSGRCFAVLQGMMIKGEDNMPQNLHANWRVDVSTLLDGLKALGV